ncbi:hypothetical protein SAMN04488096_1277 [Mesonia phycicola]|uniref:Lipoprotein n=2 Tax=Mesonia phycicola TaxID=579105 RepID=A0A1M6HXB2_9FLAO|nr:hypothetical protein SAMN04488096_1277 [Mesonia phycicola]
MKKSLCFLIVIILLISCKNPKNKELETKIIRLKELNTKLADSINRMQYKKLTSLLLVGIPKNKELIPGKPNELNFIFHSIEDLPSFNVNILNDEKENKTLYKNHKESNFTYKFIPENKTDKSFRLEAVFYLDTLVVKIPAIIGNKKLNRQLKRIDSIKQEAERNGKKSNG